MSQKALNGTGVIICRGNIFDFLSATTLYVF